MENSIIEPTLVINKKTCLANIGRMAEKAKNHNLVFRPHFKTHQSIEVGNWFRSFGISSITVSSVSMAQYFSRDNWNDITIAFPLNPREIDRINDINPQVNLNLTIENTEALDIAEKKLYRRVGVFIKIDTGYNRTGIYYNDFEKIHILIKRIEKSEKIKFNGFLIHAGHTYNCSSKKEVLAVHQDMLSKIQELRNEFQQTYPDLIISYGDTPSCSLADQFSGIDEIRPGNFAYYDLMQRQIGSCSLEDIAVAVACPVVAKHKDRSQVIIHGGAVHFSKEFLMEDGRKIFGRRLGLSDGTRPTSFFNDSLISLSQEHGVMEVRDTDTFEEIHIGEIIYVLPVHSCLTANLLKNPISF